MKFLMVLMMFLLSTITARADIVLSYHLSSFNPPTQGDTLATGTQIPTNDPLGPQITGTLEFAPGQTRYIQIAVTTNALAPTMVNGQNQFNWSTSDSGADLRSFGFHLQYPQILVTQPFTPPGPLFNGNKTNANAQSGPQPPGGGSGNYSFGPRHPVTYSYNTGANFIGGASAAVGLGVGGDGFVPTTVLAVVKVRAGMSAGGGLFQMFDLQTGPTQAAFSLGDATNLDQIIFHPSHNNYPLQVIVTPEPSSIALAGTVAVAGLWWKRRRKTIVKA